ncbi:MAG: dimethylarginine dimethylaminohydrolase family protein [Thermoplasmata archaeon]
MDRLFDKVLMRPPEENYIDCISKNPYHDKIEFGRTLVQHEYLVDLLDKEGLKVEVIQPLRPHPDGVFIQDTAIVGEESKTAILCRFGVSERRGEEESVGEYLEGLGYDVKKIRSPGTLEGGDVLVTDEDKIFVGLSKRTNESGADQLSEFLPGKEVVKVPVSEVLHLLSAVNFIGDRTLAICPDIVAKHYFDDFDMIEITRAEQETKYKNKPINMLYLGDKKVVLPKPYSKTGDILEEFGYTVKKMNISEFWKGDAGITCPILPFYKGV